MATPNTPNLESINKPLDAPEPGADPQAETSELQANQAEAVAETPRIIAGLQEGRIVDYRLNDGTVRPIIVVCAGDRTGLIAGVLFFKGREDNRNHPMPLPTDESGHLPSHSVLLIDVPYSEDATPGSWGWPTKQAVIAAGVDANAINTTVMAILEPILQRIQKQLLDVVNEKLDANVDTVNKLMDSHSAAVKEVLAEAKQPVLGEIAPAQTNQGGSQAATLAEGLLGDAGNAGTSPAAAEGEAKGVDPATQGQQAESTQAGS